MTPLQLLTKSEFFVITFVNSCGVVSSLNMPANDSSTRSASILYSTPPVFQPTNQYVVTSTQSSRRTLLPSSGCGTTATSTLQSCSSNSVTLQLPIQQLASRGETSRQSNISFQQLHGGSNNGINNWCRKAMLAVSLIAGILVCPHTHTSWFFCKIR